MVACSKLPIKCPPEIRSSIKERSSAASLIPHGVEAQAPTGARAPHRPMWRNPGRCPRYVLDASCFCSPPRLFFPPRAKSLEASSAQAAAWRSSTHVALWPLDSFPDYTWPHADRLRVCLQTPVRPRRRKRRRRALTIRAGTHSNLCSPRHHLVNLANPARLLQNHRCRLPHLLFRRRRRCRRRRRRRRRRRQRRSRVRRSRHFRCGVRLTSTRPVFESQRLRTLMSWNLLTMGLRLCRP